MKNKVKVRGESTLEQARKTWRESRSNLSVKSEWVVNATLQPFYLWEREAVPIVQEAVWAQGRSGRTQKVSLQSKLDPRTVQPVMEK
jgi:hypothetical protein